ncbi:cytochrome P450 27C1 isoform X1 [Biomphalaria glabrata]|nr:cytochrome P450 27C1 isoform X1 [Biomphalaria glabrata]
MGSFKVSSRILKKTLTRALSTTPDFQPKPFEAIPGPKGCYQWPVVGTLLLFKPFSNYTPETFHKLLDDMFDKYGPIIKLRLGAPHVIVSDPEDFQTVFRNEGKFPVRTPISLITALSKRTGLKDSMPNLKGQEWHTLRSPLNRHLLKADSALHYLEQQNQVAEEFAKLLAEQNMNPEDLAELFFRFAAESIALVTFNRRLGFFSPDIDDESKQFLQASRDGIKLIYYSQSGKSIAHTWYRNQTYREYEKVALITRRFAWKHLEIAREENRRREKEGTLNTEEPNLLLSLTKESSLSDDDISNIMSSLYSAATDSTAKNLQVLFYNLAKNPDKQEALRKEIHSVLGANGPLTAAALSQMSYLKACVKESFRLNYPVVSGPMRILSTDVILSNYTVPAGTTIMMANSRAVKTHFEETDQFMPERWLRTSESRKHDVTSHFVALPFGHGPRNCIGRRFAEQEIYLAASKVIQSLKIDLDKESWDTSFIYKLFIEPEKPLRFRFTKINSS